MKNKIICPSCGLLHEPKPVRYELENEAESFKDSLKGQEMDGDTCIISKAYIEAGPFNGERFLMETSTEFFQCPSCDNTFISQKGAVPNSQELIDLVLKQITQDVASGDLTAIEELLKQTPVAALNNYVPEEKIWDLQVTRIGIGHRTISVKARTREEAEALALEEAGNYEYSEHSSEYEIN